MKNLLKIKTQLFQQLKLDVEKRVKNAQNAMQAAESAKANQTKSSAGDKFETGRAMMQAEEDRNKIQLIKAVALKNELEKINIFMDHDHADLGSLVLTNQGNYFLSVGLGKVILSGKTYFAISLASPIGELLLGKKVKESVFFRGKEIEILALG